LLLAEFKYDGVVDETFGSFLQSSPNFLMFYLKKFVFPLAYWEFMSRGIWKGRKGLMLTKDI
jgi:sulfide:quinone oxidoreductase